MTKTPETPFEKKGEVVENELSTDEKVKLIERGLENIVNYFGKALAETELKTQNELSGFHNELTKTLTLMNMSTLQNIVAIREVIKLLLDAKVIDGAALEQNINVELTKAIELQHKAMMEAAQQATAEGAQKAG